MRRLQPGQPPNPSGDVGDNGLFIGRFFRLHPDLLQILRSTVHFNSWQGSSFGSKCARFSLPSFGHHGAIDCNGQRQARACIGWKFEDWARVLTDGLCAKNAIIQPLLEDLPFPEEPEPKLWSLLRVAF